MSNLPPLPLPPHRIALIGAGRVGTAVARLLVDAGHEIVGVASRSTSSAQTAASFLEAPILAMADDGWKNANLVLLGTSDDAIAVAADGLAPLIAPGTVVCHFAGSWGVEPLRGVIDAGGRPCAAHPVQAIPDPASGMRNLPGSVWGVTAAADVGEWMTDLIEAGLAGRVVAVPEESRPLWHAAAVITSNGLAALLALGEAVLASGGLGETVDVLGPLARGTLANAEAGGGGAATLTGPVVRGEGPAIVRHLTAMTTAAPELADEYRRVQLVVLDRAIASGRLDGQQATSLLSILAPEGFS